MYLWRKSVGLNWLSAHEEILRARARGALAIISRPERRRVLLEIPCKSHSESRKLLEEFGGRTEKWPRDWLKRFADPSKPLKIGKRLLISSKGDFQIAPAVGKPPLLLIPASAAFGTGEHATTAMSLRILERLTRKWKGGWSLADLGTGSGILALAAKCFGAGRVTGIDIDPKAISIAKENARLNKIDNVDFQQGDLHKWKPPDRKDVVAANLYSELLVEILPKLKQNNWLILSGILRTQENKLLLVLQRNNMAIVNVKRRGKWIAVLAHSRIIDAISARSLKNKDLRWRGCQLGSFSLGGFGFSAFHAV